MQTESQTRFLSNIKKVPFLQNDRAKLSIPYRISSMVSFLETFELESQKKKP
jgi:hypothetical protein